MTRLLRAATFCRPLHAPEVDVVLEFQPEKGDGSAVFGSVDLLVQLSVKDGDVVWLTFSEELRLPAVIHVDNGMTGTKILKVPPTMVHCGRKSCRVHACTADVQPAPSTVVVRPLGVPVELNLLLRDHHRQTEYPDIGSIPRLIASSSLLSLLKDDQVFVYQVLNLPMGPCWTAADTEWKLDACPAGVSLPQLPPLDRTKQYLKNQPCQVEPHPSLDKVVKALSVKANTVAQQKVVHIIGSTDNHVDKCVETASHSIGRRYLRVNGLAAFAHASGKTVTTGSTQDKMAGCEAALQRAQRSAPCVLHLVNLEDELSSDDEPLRHMLEMRLWTLLTTLLRLQPSADSPPCHYAPPVTVVLSTRTPLAAGPLERQLVFAPVVVEEPDESYARYLWNDDESFEKASDCLEGKTARDIVKYKRLWLNSNQDVVSFLQQMSKPESQKMSQIPNVHWDDIGGLGHVRKEIMDAIELPLQHPDLFRGTRRSGILLYGPPGTGKTLVAKAVATECGLPFFSVKGPELLGSYVGESEANVREIFARAREVAAKNRAAVLFFDELDSLAPRRGGLGDGGGVMERVVATLLTELDEEDSVFFVGATNRPDLLDPSLLRPGRLDRRVYLGVPSEYKQRAQLLAALIRKFRLEHDDPMYVALQVVGKLPQNLSGADFSAIASGALMLSLKRLCDSVELEVTPTRSLDDILNERVDISPLITANDLLVASRTVVPSITAEDHRRYQRLREDFSS